MKKALKLAQEIAYKNQKETIKFKSSIFLNSKASQNIRFNEIILKLALPSDYAKSIPNYFFNK